jgi:hypothetical protein
VGEWFAMQGSAQGRDQPGPPLRGSGHNRELPNVLQSPMQTCAVTWVTWVTWGKHGSHGRCTHRGAAPPPRGWWRRALRCGPRPAPAHTAAHRGSAGSRGGIWQDGTCQDYVYIDGIQTAHIDGIKTVYRSVHRVWGLSFGNGHPEVDPHAFEPPRIPKL